MESSSAPTRKVAAGTLGAGVGTVIVGVAVWLGAPEPPIGLEGGIATVVGFLAAYFTNNEGA